ncbi:MAG: hypothetical protein ACJ0DI_05065 [bacterium]
MIQHQLIFGVWCWACSPKATSSTQNALIHPPAVALQEVQASGISQNGITQYLEIKMKIIFGLFFILKFLLNPILANENLNIPNVFSSGGTISSS